MMKEESSLSEFLSHRGVDNTEHSDPLGLQGNGRLARVGREWLSKSGVGAVRRLPFEFALLHLGEVLVVAEGAFSDSHVTGGNSTISTLVKSCSVGRHVEGRCLGWSTIEQVRKILQAQEHLVLGLGELKQFEVSVEV